MGRLVAVGGLHVPSAFIRSLSLALDDVCKDFGFPSDRDEFKWSPHRGTWMRKNLEAEDRHAFFSECLKQARVHDGQACVVIEDETHKTTAGKRDGHELDAVKVFLERTHLEKIALVLTEGSRNIRLCSSRIRRRAIRMSIRLMTPAPLRTEMTPIDEPLSESKPPLF
jgi:hypothetical protein